MITYGESTRNITTFPPAALPSQRPTMVAVRDTLCHYVCVESVVVHPESMLRQPPTNKQIASVRAFLLACQTNCDALAQQVVADLCPLDDDVQHLVALLGMISSLGIEMSKYTVPAGDKSWLDFLARVCFDALTNKFIKPYSRVAVPPTQELVTSFVLRRKTMNPVLWKCIYDGLCIDV